MPQPRGVPALRVPPRVRAHRRLGVLEPRHLAPVVPGEHERVAHGGSRRGEVAGERVGLQQQALRGSPCRTRRTRRDPSWPRPRYGELGTPVPIGDSAWVRRTARAARHDARAMTSLLAVRPRSAPSADVERDLATRRPLALLALLGGVAAAAGTLVVCLGLGGRRLVPHRRRRARPPSGALRVGALGWLMGHGSGVRIEGVPITAMPLGITLLAAWAIWRLGLRVGDSVSGHGPDADADRRRRARLDGADRARAVHCRVRRHRGPHRHPGRDRRPPTRAPRGWCCGRCCSAWASAARRSRSAPAGPRSGRPRCRPWSGPRRHGCRRILQLWLAVAAAGLRWSRWSSTSAPPPT